MISSAYRPFRIEKYGQARNDNAPSGLPEGKQYIQVMAEIRELKDLIRKEVVGAAQQRVRRESPSQNTPPLKEELKTEAIAAQPSTTRDNAQDQRIKSELKEIYGAIEETKQEIINLQETGAEGMEMGRVADELAAVVKGTEKATDSILSSAEEIDLKACNLAASLTDESLQNMACDIQDSVIKIFESCNFQDLTGQRITKVVKAFLFVEQRVLKMVDIWGGEENFGDITPIAREDRMGDKALLNGPALEEDSDVASQADIDTLFD